jgi:hypothetical protein
MGEIGYQDNPMLQISNITITTEIIKFISEVDEFKGKW